MFIFSPGMCLPEYFTRSCVYTPLMCTVHKCKLSVPIILNCIFAAYGLTVIHGTAKTGDKFLFYFHFRSSAGASATSEGVISSSIPVSL